MQDKKERNVNKLIAIFNGVILNLLNLSVVYFKTMSVDQTV